jgi:Glycosyl transferases group 1
VLSLEQAAAERWDAVMVPGAGWAAPLLPRFSALKIENFGIRVQHVLNDQSNRRAFKEINDAFAPHLVIFNNEYWPPGSFTDFAGDRFHVLLGGVDTQGFRPAVYRSHALSIGRWVIGGLANKNPEPLVGALSHLPREVTLRLYGPDAQDLENKHADLIALDRLQLTGPLQDGRLRRFYHGVDCVVSTEEAAGWANLGAEALASGVPLVCTPRGTSAFARHQLTALIVDEPSPAAITRAVLQLRGDAGLCRRLAEAGREAICAFSWEVYARQLLALLEHDGQRHYIHSPADGRFGKWPLSDRLRGLDRLLDQADGQAVLDLGAAEGMVGREFLRRGARLLHGLEIDPARVRTARTLCMEWAQASFRAADLSDCAALSPGSNGLLDGYDVVLYLGIHQHLPRESRSAVIERAIGLARGFIAIRCPPEVFEAENIDDTLGRTGFVPLAEDGSTSTCAHLGVCRVYRRVAAGLA